MVVFVFALIAVAVIYVKKFTQLPSEEQIEKVKEWLLWAVIEAEKNFKGGTGALKLRYVYDLFIKAFPSIAPIVSFDLFKAWVDEVLEQMRHLIDTNKNISDYVEGE